MDKHTRRRELKAAYEAANGQEKKAIERELAELGRYKAFRNDGRLVWVSIP